MKPPAGCPTKLRCEIGGCDYPWMCRPLVKSTALATTPPPIPLAAIMSAPPGVPIQSRLAQLFRRSKPPAPLALVQGPKPVSDPAADRAFAAALGAPAPAPQPAPPPPPPQPARPRPTTPIEVIPVLNGFVLAIDKRPVAVAGSGGDQLAELVREWAGGAFGG